MSPISCSPQFFQNGVQSPDDLFNESTSTKLRDYLNSAVYLEPTCDLNASQMIYVPGSGDHSKMVTVKRCACLLDPDKCPCHPQLPKDAQQETPENAVAEKRVEAYISPRRSESSSTNITGTSSESSSDVTVKASSSSLDLRIAIPSLTTIEPDQATFTRTCNENYREWCRRKDYEKKLQAERDMLIQKIKEQQKQALLELERENFERWLANKRNHEIQTQKLRQRDQEEKRKSDEEKQKRLQENAKNFHAWLRKKKTNILEKKIREQIQLIEIDEQRQRRFENSQKAYEHWKERAKCQQKPIPFGRGIDTLKSSSSVSYINPEPWVPNIITTKPHSQ